MAQHRTGAIATLIAEYPLCLDCIAEKSGTDREVIAEALVVISRLLTLRRTEQSRCGACGEIGVTLSLDRPGSERFRWRQG